MLVVGDGMVSECGMWVTGFSFYRFGYGASKLTSSYYQSFTRDGK